MPNVRNTSLKKYNISKHRFSELYHHCLQYNKWMDELTYKCDAVHSIEITNFDKYIMVLKNTIHCQIIRKSVNKFILT